MKETNVRNVIRIQMFRLKKRIKGIPAYPCMPLFYRRVWCAAWFSVCLFLLEGCHTDTRYHVYRAVSGTDGWSKSDSMEFVLPADVPAGTYGMEIGIRHTGEYPYRDIWLSVTKVEGDSLPSHTDTLHIYLADEEGHWKQHGGAIGGLFQQTSVCGKPVTLLADSITRCFRVTHLMRQNPLPGISDVGIRLFLAGSINAEKDEQQDGKSPK